MDWQWEADEPCRLPEQRSATPATGGTSAFEWGVECSDGQVTCVRDEAAAWRLKESLRGAQRVVRRVVGEWETA